MVKKKLDATFWALRSDKGWLQYAERFLIEDNKPGHGIVLLRTRADALAYAKDFEIGTGFKPRRVRVTEKMPR